MARSMESEDEPIVYLVQKPSVPKNTGKILDTTPLKRYGNVVTLVDVDQYPSFRPHEALRQISERLKGFNPERDYIAVAGGDSLGVILTGVVLADLGHEYFQYLRFERARRPDGTRDPAKGGYALVEVPLFLPEADAEDS
jgi:hypothetical protein